MFFIFFINIFLSAILIFLSKNPIHSILYLVFCFLNASFLLMFFGLDFIALLFIMIYVGAIAVLFIFIIMMLNLKLIELKESFLSYLPFIFYFILLLFYEFSFIFSGIFANQELLDFFSYSSLLGFLADNSWNNVSITYQQNSIQHLSFAIYLYFYIVLWLAGILLLCALVGIIIIALHKNLYVKRQDFYSQIIKEEQYAISLSRKNYKNILGWNFFLNFKY